MRKKMVDAVALVVKALVAGAAQGVGDAAKEGVHDAYQWLRSCLGKRLGDHQEAEIVLARHETDPETWDKPLRQLVTETGAATDVEVLEAAQRLMSRVDPEGFSGL